jgi:hypothetical protein
MKKITKVAYTRLVETYILMGHIKITTPQEGNKARKGKDLCS